MKLFMLWSLLMGKCPDIEPVSHATVEGKSFLLVRVSNKCDTAVSVVTPASYSIEWNERGKIRGFGSSPSFEMNAVKPSVTFSPHASLDILLPFSECKKCKVSTLRVSIDSP